MTPLANRRTRLPWPWRRTDSGTGTCGARYEDGRGYVIQHCGHPTANWPYALYGRDGQIILAPNGRAWPTSKAAAAHVETLP